MARHAIDRKHLALGALDQRFVFLDLGSDSLNLIPSDDVAACVNGAVGFHPVELIVAKTTVLSIAMPVLSSGHKEHGTGCANSMEQDVYGFSEDQGQFRILSNPVHDYFSGQILIQIWNGIAMADSKPEKKPASNTSYQT